MSMPKKMKKIRLSNKLRKTLRGSSRGVTLIEVLVALVIFGIIAIVFAGGLGTASKAVFTADVRTNAESLARTQMEYAKSQGYIDYSEEPHEDYDLITPPEGYEIAVTATELNDGLQKITVTVSHEGRQVMTLEGYKVHR